MAGEHYERAAELIELDALQMLRSRQIVVVLGSRQLESELVANRD